jgi:hypothetical protein
MPTNVLDVAGAWSNAGKQLFGGEAAFMQGKSKMAQELAKTAAFDSQARLNNAKAEQEQQRAMYQRPEFASKIAANFAGLNDRQGDELVNFQQNETWGIQPTQDMGDQFGPPTVGNKPAPQWYSPDVEKRFNMARGAHMAGLGGTGNSNNEQTAKAFAELMGQGRIDDALARGGPAALNALQSAIGGKMYEFKEFGTGDQSTGKVAFNQPYLDKNRSEVRENYAQAGNANASAALSRSKVGQPTVNPDGSVTRPMPAPKPIPASALKMQNEGLENISIASNINPMLQRFTDDIEAGRLKLGPVANAVSAGRNFAGASNEVSKNYASFKATLEKLRNDSLRLNKGVQTDGDAQRAWEELMSNINDPGVVKQRIAEIQEINAKAVELHRMNVNQIRRNYGHPDIDTTGYEAQPKPAAPQQAPAKNIQRGQVIDGYRFKGGDPGNQANWEKL